MIDKIGPIIASLVSLAIGAVVTVLMVNASGALYDELHDHGDINGQAFTRLYANDGQDASGNAIARGTAYKVQQVRDKQTAASSSATTDADTYSVCAIGVVEDDLTDSKLYTLQGTEMIAATGGVAASAAQTRLQCIGSMALPDSVQWEEAMKAAQRLSGLNNVVTSLLPFIVTLSFIVTVFAKGFLREGSMGGIKEILVKEVIILFATLAAIYLAPSLFQFIEGLYFAVSSGHPMLGLLGQGMDVFVGLMPTGIVLAIIGIATDRSLRAATGKGLYERGKGYYGRSRGMSM